MDKKDLIQFKIDNRRVYEDLAYEYTSRIKKAYLKIFEELNYKEKMNINVTREKNIIKKLLNTIQEELSKW